jgi:hypothetical protein
MEDSRRSPETGVGDEGLPGLLRAAAAPLGAVRRRYVLLVIASSQGLSSVARLESRGRLCPRGSWMSLG